MKVVVSVVRFETPSATLAVRVWTPVARALVGWKVAVDDVCVIGASGAPSRRSDTEATAIPLPASE